MQELISLRQENSKTFDLGNGRRRCEISSGILHWKEDYTDESESWKECDLTIRDGNVTQAPYNLTIDGKKLTFQDKKINEVSTLELVSVKPAGLKFEIIPHSNGVSFQHILPTDKVPFEAQFKITGKIPLSTRAFDDEGEIELEASLVDDILIEKLSQIKDKLTGKIRAAKGQIRIDPTLTVQPSAKDTHIRSSLATTNYGSDTGLTIFDRSSDKIRAILEFSLSGLYVGATINSASLQLYYYGYYNNDPVGKTVWAYKLTRTDWVEAEATWNIYKTDSNWTAAGGDYVTSAPSGGSVAVPASYGWTAFDVLAIVQDAYAAAVSAEFLAKFADETISDALSAAVYWYSKEYTGDTSLRPKLVIDYTVFAQKSLSGALTLSGTLGRKTKVSKAGALNMAGAVSTVHKTFKSLSGALNLTGAVVGVCRQAKAIAGTLNLTGAVSTMRVKFLSGTLNLSGSLSSIKGIFKSLAGTLNMTGAVSGILKIFKSIAGSLSFTGLVSVLRKIIGAGAVSVDSYLETDTFHLSKFTAEFTGIVSKIKVYSEGSCNVKVAVYSDVGGEPSSLLSVVNTSTAVVAGWNTITIPSVSVGQGMNYWLAFNSG